MDILETFVAVFFAFVVKDFYDIFISSHIRTLLSNYKLLITKTKKE